MDHRVCLLLLHLTLAAGNPCTGRLLGSQPDPQDCRAYVVCWMSIPYPKTCSDDQLYDVQTSSCQPSHLSICCNITFPASTQRTLPPVTSNLTSISSSSPIPPVTSYFSSISIPTTKHLMPSIRPPLSPIRTSSKLDTLTSTPSEVTSFKLSPITPTSVTESDSTTIIKPSIITDSVTTVSSIQPITVTEPETTVTPIRPTVIETATTELSSKITDSVSTETSTTLTPIESSQITESVNVLPTTVTSVITTTQPAKKPLVISELPSTLTDSINTEIPTTFYPTMPPITTVKQSIQATQETTVRNNKPPLSSISITDIPSTSSNESTFAISNTTEKITVIAESTTNQPTSRNLFTSVNSLHSTYSPAIQTTVDSSDSTPTTEPISTLKPQITIVSEDFSTTATLKPLPPVTINSSENTPLVSETNTQPITKTTEPVQITDKTTPTQTILSAIFNPVSKTSEIPIRSSKIPCLPPVTATITEIIATESLPVTESVETPESVTSTTLATSNEEFSLTTSLLTTQEPLPPINLTSLKPTSAIPVVTTLKPIAITSETISTILKPVITTGHPQTSLEPTANPLSTILESISISTTVKPNIITDDKIKPDGSISISKIPVNNITITKSEFLTSSVPSTVTDIVTSKETTISTEAIESTFTQTAPVTEVPDTILNLTITTVPVHKSTTTLPPKIMKHLTTNTSQSTIDNTVTIKPISSSKSTNQSASKSTIPQTTIYLSTSNEPEATTTIEPSSETSTTNKIPSNITSTLSSPTISPTSISTEINLTPQLSITSPPQSSSELLSQTSPLTLSSIVPSQSTLVTPKSTKLASKRPLPTLPPASTTTYIPPCFTSPKPSSTATVPLPIPICRPDDEFLYPDLNSCSFYYECLYGIMRKMKCKIGYQFSPRALKCMPRIEANCRILSSTMQNAYLEKFIQLHDLQYNY